MARQLHETRFAGLTGVGWRRSALILGLLIAVALPFLSSDYRTYQFTNVLLWAIAVLGLNMLTGYCGQISLGHGAFYAIGAYATAVMIDKGEVPYYLAIPMGGVVAMFVGFLFGYPAGRLRGHYLALATFGLAIAVPQILKYDLFEPWTGGVQGIFIFKPDPPAWLPLELSKDQWLYFFSLGILLVLFFAAWNILRSRSGRAMIAIRTQHIAAEAMGVNTALYKSLTFGLSAFYTGIAGALSAIVVEFVSPDSFTFFISIWILIGMVVGGLGSIWGAVFGGLVIVYLPNVAEDVFKVAPAVVYGLILIVVMYFMPMGAAGFVRLMGARIMRKWGTTDGEPDQTSDAGQTPSASR